MEFKNYDIYIRHDSNKKEFCISECVKKLKNTLSEKETECLNTCLKSYEKALSLALDFESGKTKAQ